MGRARLLTACSLVAAAAGVAMAQPAAPQPAAPPPASPPPVSPGAEPPAPPPPPATTPATPAPATPALRSLVYDRRDDAAWKLYHEAFRELLHGRRHRAGELIERLAREHPGHPATALVERAPLATGRERAQQRQRRREEESSGAKAELALFQTLHGLALGLELCVVLECDSAEGFVGLTLLGGISGAVASLKAVPRLTSGQRALLNSGAAWGAINAMLGIFSAEPDDNKVVGLSLIAGQGAGLAAGGLLFGLRPTAGQVALANSGGQWAAVLMALALQAANPELDSRSFSLALLVGADAGLGVGAYLATLWPEVSRAQTLVIDAGGIVGTIGGGGLGVLIAGSRDARATPAIAAVGGAVGLAAAAYLTRSWSDRDDEDDGVHAVLTPAEHGRGGLLGLAGTW